MKAPIKRSLTAVGAVAAAATLAVAVPTSSAHAITPTHCSNFDADIEIYQGGAMPDHCFIGPGTLDVAIYGVDRIFPGKKRAVSVKFQRYMGSEPEKRYIPVGEGISYKIHKLTRIHVHR